MTAKPVDVDKLVALMAGFEAGTDFGDNPFDASSKDSTITTAMNAIEAFQHGTTLATWANSEEDPGEEDLVAFCIAGFLQGLCIGYEYAKSGS